MKWTCNRETIFVLVDVYRNVWSSVSGYRLRRNFMGTFNCTENCSAKL